MKALQSKLKIALEIRPRRKRLHLTGYIKNYRQSRKVKIRTNQNVAVVSDEVQIDFLIPFCIFTLLSDL